jgi:hypothetical protein
MSGSNSEKGKKKHPRIVISKKRLGDCREVIKAPER